MNYISSIYTKLEHPEWYIGGEVGSISKKESRVKCAVTVLDEYPQASKVATYKAIYQSINDIDKATCQRVFMPTQELYDALLKTKSNYVTIEDKTEILTLDILFVVINSAVEYVNLLQLLKISNIHINKHERKENEPVVIVCGKPTFNPKPIEDFVDAYMYGDEATLSGEIVKVCMQFNIKEQRQKFMQQLNSMAGVYVPEIEQDKQVYMLETLPSIIKREVVPYTNSNANEYILSRGCNRTCTFCSEKYIYGFSKEINQKQLVQDICENIKGTGYTEANIITNCYADCSYFPMAIYDIKRIKGVKSVYVKPHLSSSNLWTINNAKNTKIAKIMVGSENEQVRKHLGISIQPQNAIDTAGLAIQAGVYKIQLIYILGVENETYEDLDKMLFTANKVCETYNKNCYIKPIDNIVEIKILYYVPAPHTKNERCGVSSVSKIELKLKYLTEENKNEFIKITSEVIEKREIEAILLRGNNLLGPVILDVANVDEIAFNYDSWQIAFKKEKIDSKIYLAKIPRLVPLVWNNIHTIYEREEGIINEDIGDK